MKVQLNARVDEDVKRELDRIRKETGLTIETIVRDSLAFFAGVRTPVLEARARLFKLVLDSGEHAKVFQE